MRLPLTSPSNIGCIEVLSIRSPVSSARSALHQRALLTTILPCLLLMSLVGCATTLTTTVSGLDVIEHIDGKMPPGCEQAFPTGGCYQQQDGKHHIWYSVVSPRWVREHEIAHVLGMRHSVPWIGDGKQDCAMVTESGDGYQKGSRICVDSTGEYIERPAEYAAATPITPAPPFTDINKLLPSGADALLSSLSSLPTTETPRNNVYIGGTKAMGRVAEVYVTVAQDVFLFVDKAPKHLRGSGERWIDIQFPDALANGSESYSALISGNQAVQVGDIVEIRIAHTKVSRDFPVKETTRVTGLVAKNGEMLAKNYERRILARTRQGSAAGPAAEWLKFGVSQPGANVSVPPTAVSSVR